VDALIDLKEVYDAWDTPERDKKVMSVGLKTGVGGAGAGLATYFVCTLGFGLPSAGTSMFWCGALAGGSGAIAGGKLGEYASDKLYDTKWGKRFVRGLVEVFTIPSAY